MRNNLPVIKNNHHKLKCEFDKIGRIVISKNTKRYRLNQVIDNESLNNDTDLYCKKLQNHSIKNILVQNKKQFKKKLVQSKSQKYTIPVCFKPLAQIIGEKMNLINKKFVETTREVDNAIKLGDMNMRVNEDNPQKFSLNQNNHIVSKNIYKNNIIKLYDRRMHILNDIVYY